jgi:hypothetical protein
MSSNSSKKTRAAKRIQMTYRKKRNRNINLSEFIYNLDYEGLEKALQNGANPNKILLNSKFFKGEFTYLCLAVKYLNTSAVELLLQYGADPNNNRSKNYPINCWDLHEYIDDIREGDPSLVLEIIEMLLISGADPNIIDINDNTPLLYALKLNEITDYDGFYNYTYLHKYGKPIIELLLQYGADPRKKNNKGINALMKIDMIVSEPTFQCTHIQKLLYDKAIMLDEIDRLLLSQRRLAMSKHLLTDNNSTFGNITHGNPMSYMDYDTMLELSKYM